MNYLLILIPGITASTSSVCIRTFQHKLQKNQHSLRVFQFVYILMVTVAFLLIAGFRLPTDPYAWFLGLGFAFCLFFSSIGTTMSLLTGPMTLTSVINSCNVILPILFGCIFRQEVMGLVHIIGCILLLATLMLSSIGPVEQKREISPKWYLYIAMSFLGNGVGAIIVSSYNLLSGGVDNNNFLAAAFLITSVLLLANTSISWKRDAVEEPLFPKLSPLFLLLSAGAAFGCFGTNIVLIFLVNVIPTSLLYPIYNGIATVLTCLISCLVFREPMNLKKLITILLGLGAITLLNL